MRIWAGSAALMVVLALLATAGVVKAEPDGTQTASFIDVGGGTFLSPTGMTPGPLTIYSATPGQPYSPAKQRDPQAQADGHATIYVQSSDVAPAGYLGPVWIVVCDSQGACVQFFVTIRAGHPSATVGSQGTLKVDCYVLHLFLNGDRSPEVMTYLNLFSEAQLRQMARDCDFTTWERGKLFNLLFEDR